MNCSSKKRKSSNCNKRKIFQQFDDEEDNDFCKQDNNNNKEAQFRKVLKKVKSPKNQNLGSQQKDDNNNNNQRSKPSLTNKQINQLNQFLITPKNTQYKLEEAEKEGCLQLLLKFTQSLLPNKIYPYQVNKGWSIAELSDQIAQNVLEEEHLNICFYSKDGTPLLSSMFQYGEQFCGEEFYDGEIVICICSKTGKQSVQISVSPDQGSDKITVIGNGKNGEEKHTIKCYLQSDTVSVLKQKLFVMNHIACYKMQINFNNKQLSDRVVLAACGIKNNDIVNVRCNIFFDEEPNLSSELYHPQLQHFHTATEEGLRELRCHLTVMRSHLTQEQQVLLLGLLRDLSENNAPMVLALRSFFQYQKINLASKIAIEEGLYSTFATLLIHLPNIQNLKDNKKMLLYTPNNLFCLSRIAFSLMMRHISSISKEVNQIWRKREVFVDKLICQVTQKVIEGEPNYLLLDNYQQIQCDRSQVLALAQAKKEIAGLIYFSNDKLIYDPYLIKLQKVINRHLKERDARLTLWQPQREYASWNPAVEDLQLQKLGENWLKDLQDYQNQDPKYKLYQPMELKSQLKPQTTPPQLTYNQYQQLIIYLKPSLNQKQTLWVRDILESKEKIASPEELAGLINENKENPPKKFIEEPKEAVAIVLDATLEMNSVFQGTLKKLEAAQILVNAFINRLIALNCRCVLALVTYNSKVELKQDFTEQLELIEGEMQKQKYQDDSRVYDALDLAINRLVDVKKINLNTEILRIITFKSDHYDHSILSDPVKIKEKLVNNDIKIDVIQFGAVEQNLKHTAKDAGGCLFEVNNLFQGIQLFESEGFLKYASRDKSNQRILYCESLINKQKKSQIEFLEGPFFISQRDNYVNAKVFEKATLGSQVINKNQPLCDKGLNHRLKRICKELDILQLDDNNQNIKVLPLEEDFTFWKVLMKAPPLSLYKSGVYMLSVQFPEAYPQDPPIIRFATPIYHCNVASNGLICLRSLLQDYQIDMSIKTVLNEIYQLLENPQPENSINSLLAYAYYNDFPTYKRYIFANVYQQGRMPSTQLAQLAVGINGKETQQHVNQVLEWLDREKIPDLFCQQ